MAIDDRIITGLSLRRTQLAGSALALVLASQLCSPARASNECGDGSSGTVVCSASNNPYANGISYVSANSLTVNTDTDTLVNGTINVQTAGDTVVNHQGAVNAIDGAPGLPGINVYGGKGATVSGGGSVNTYASSSIGVSAYSPGNVAVAVGQVNTTGDHSTGVEAFVFGAGNTIVTTGNISTNGASAFGVSAYSAGGGVSVTTGDVTTVGAGSTGVLAGTGGTGNTIVTTGNISTNGASAFGVYANSVGGDVSVTTGDVTTAGDGATGINASSNSGNASVTVTNATAANAQAVSVISSAGDASLTVNGSLSAPSSNLLGFISGATSATFNLGSSGTLTGPVQLISSGQNVVNNAGIITGGSVNPVIIATNAGLEFNNSGYFSGLINLNTSTGQAASFNNNFANSGTYVAQSLDFGSGSNSFVNSGRLELQSGVTSPQSVTFANLTTFTNSGLIDLRNGQAGDILTLGGTYVGKGTATLAVDVTYGTYANILAADQLKVAGAITGTTIVILNPTTQGKSTLGRTTFAQGGTGSSPTAFVLSSSTPINNPLLTQSIDYQSADNIYTVVTAPSDGVFRIMKLSEAAQQIWYASTDVWLSHIDILRDQMLDGKMQYRPKVWGQIYGQSFKRSDEQDTTVFGVDRDMDLSYKQNNYGGQLGVDYGLSDILSTGITGGFVESRVNYATSNDRSRINDANIGITATAATPALFATVLGKYDHYWINVDGADEGFQDKLHGNSIGLHGEIGAQLYVAGFNLQPIVGIDYVRTRLSELQAFGDTIDFNNLEGFRMHTGGRVNYAFAASGTKPSAVLYFQGDYVKDFDGTNGIVFGIGDQSAAFSNDRIRPYATGKIGVTVTAAHGLSGFAEAFGATGSAYKGGGVRVGVTKAF